MYDEASHLPCSQWVLVQPGAHTHSYSLVRSRQVALFWQGLLAHSKMSDRGKQILISTKIMFIDCRIVLSNMMQY